jgi:hypothetical protein
MLISSDIWNGGMELPIPEERFGFPHKTQACASVSQFESRRCNRHQPYGSHPAAIRPPQDQQRTQEEDGTLRALQRLQESCSFWPTKSSRSNARGITQLTSVFRNMAPFDVVATKC